MFKAKAQTLDASPDAPGEEAKMAESDSVEVSGRADSPPPAHGGAEPSAPAAPSWSYPSGIVAGRDTPPAPKRASTPPPMVASHGPEGKRRSRVVVIALSVVTLGVYALIWHSRINTEVADFDPRMHVRPGTSTLAVTLAWLLGLLISLAGAARIVIDTLKVSLPFDPHFTVTHAYFLLGGLVVIPYLMLVLPFSIVAIVMTLERVRMAEDRAGKTSDVQIRPVRSACWLLVPIAGGLVLMSVMQRRLNQIWEIAAPAPAARISRF